MTLQILKHRKIIFKEKDDQCYGRVVDILGNGRFLVDCFDGLTRFCLLRGRYRNKNFFLHCLLRKYYWIEKGAVVLISIRSVTKGDIVFKYSHEEEEYIKEDRCVLEIIIEI